MTTHRERSKELNPAVRFTAVFLATIVVGLFFNYAVFGEFGINISLRSNTQLESGLAAYYTFDGSNVGTSTVTDQSGSGRNILFMGMGGVATTSFVGATTTYTVPSNRYYGFAKVWGAGGGGGAGTADGATPGVGGPGGSGGYASSIFPLSPGESITFETGAGGIGTAGRGGNGGGATTIKRGIAYLIIAAGGGGGGYADVHGSCQDESLVAQSNYGGYGGHGGGENGGHGSTGSCQFPDPDTAGGAGYGGSQLAGGAGGSADATAFNGIAGVANAGGNSTSSTCGSATTGCGGSSTSGRAGGGGGGGYFGGGGGEAATSTNVKRYSDGGGGGSGYVSGVFTDMAPGTSDTTPGNYSDLDRIAFGSTAGNGGAGTSGTGAGSTGTSGLIVLRLLDSVATATVSVGRIGQSVELNGVYQYLSIATSTDPLRNVSAATFAAWVYVDSMASTSAATSSEQVLLDITSGTSTTSPRLEVKLVRDPQNATNVNSSYVRVSSIAGDGEAVQMASSTVSIIKAGVWTHVAAAVDYQTDTVAIYINGVAQSLNGTVSFTGTATSNTSPLSAEIGRNAGVMENMLDGRIDDIRLYHRALTASEVSRLYHLGATTEITKTLFSPTNTVDGLLSHWTFDGKDMNVATVTNRIAGGLDGLATSSVGTYATTTFMSSASTTLPSVLFFPTIFVKAWGAGGGGGGQGGATGGAAGGGGAFASTTITVTPGETLNVYVGTGGAGGSAYTDGLCGALGAGGVYGGGSGGNGDSFSKSGCTAGGGGGGGGGGGAYSAVTRNSTTLMVAAGGGGGGAGSTASTAGAGGAGGAATGVDGGDNSGDAATGGGGGQAASGGTAGTGNLSGTAGGSLGGGNGGSASTATFYGGGGGGGAGYFGGGGGSAGSGSGSASGGGGGGGSSYIGGGSGGDRKAGSGTTPGNSSDADRVGSAGNGASAGSPGTNGVVLISYAFPDGPDPTPGRIGQGLDFNGTNQLVKVGNVGSGIKTVAFWMKADDTTVRQILNFDGTDLIELNSSSQVTATSFPGTTVVYVDGQTSSTVVATSTWHHVVITDTTGVNGSTFEIGRAASSYFDGILDDVRLYNRVLTANEVQRLYHLGATTRVNTAVSQTSSGTANGLLQQWTFDGPFMGTSTVNNSISEGMQGLYESSSVVATSTKVLGRIGQAIRIPATGGGIVRVRGPLSNFPTSAITASVWVNLAQHASFVTYLDNNWQLQNGSWTLFSDSSGYAYFGVYSASTQFNAGGSGCAIPLNEWVHISGSYDGTTVRVYLNGTACGSTASVSSVTLYTGGDLQIGEGSDGQPYPLDDVRLYGRALTASEIKKVYQSGNPRSSLFSPFAMELFNSFFAHYGETLYASSGDVIRTFKAVSAEQRGGAFAAEPIDWWHVLQTSLYTFAEASDDVASSHEGGSVCLLLPSAEDAVMRGGDERPTKK